MAASVIATVVSVVAAVCARILADELKAWRPWLTGKLIAFAARWVPDDQRDRYEEEWSAYVEETPGGVGRVFAALGLLWAATQIGFVSWKHRQKGADATEGGKRQRRVGIVTLLNKISEFVNRFEAEFFMFGSASQLVSCL